MINTREKLNEVLSKGNKLDIKSFLDNCIFWDAKNIDQIKEYIEIIEDKFKNDSIFDKDNGEDLSKYKNTQEDLDKLYAESMFNYSKEKYLHRLSIANALSQNKEVKDNNQVKFEKKVQIKKEESKENIHGKKKLALIIVLMILGAIIFWMMKKLIVK